MRLLELREITKTYDAATPVKVLDGVDLVLSAGEKIAILGRSGSGKSTLLNILGLLDRATSGEYLLDSSEIALASEHVRDMARADKFGFVFQESHVLSQRSASENIWLALAASKMPSKERTHRVAEVLTAVGLEHRSQSLGSLLSGGERQRLAVARAISTSPQILLADEPTGNLDEENSQSVLSLFDDQVAAGVGAIVITHDKRVARWAHRVFELSNGKLKEVGG